MKKTTIKRALALFMILALVLGCASCALFKNYDYVNEALAAAAAWDHAKLTIRTDVQVTADGENEALSEAYGVTLSGLTTNSPKFMTEMDVTLYGDEIPAAVYYEAPYYYIVTEYESVKTEAGALLAKSDFVSDWKRATALISEDALKTAEETVNEATGAKTVTVLPDANAFLASYEGLLMEWYASLVADYIGEYSESNMNITEPKIAVTVTGDEVPVFMGTAASCRMEITAKTAAGEDVSVSALFTHTVMTESTDETVTLPEGAADFELTDGVTLDPYKITKEAIDAALALTDLDVTLTVSFVNRSEGMEQESLQTMNVKSTGITTGSWRFFWEADREIYGEEFHDEVYYEYGTFYANMTGALPETKYERTPENEDFFSYTDDVYHLVKSFAKSDLADASVQKNADGTRTVSFSLSAERFFETHRDMVTDYLSDVWEAEEKEIKDILFTIVVDRNGDLISYTNEFTYTTVYDGTEYELKTSQCLEYHSFGETVTVEPMAGYQDFLSVAEKNAEVYKRANAAIEAVKNADTLSVYQYTYAGASGGGSSTEAEIECVTEARDLKNAPKFRMLRQYNMMGVQINEDVYYENGYYYIDLGVAQTKVPAAHPDVADYNVLQNIDAFMIALPEEWTDRAEIEVLDDGYTVLYIDLTNDLQKLVPNLYEQYMENAAGLSLTRKSIVYGYVEIYLDTEGRLASYELAYELDFAVGVAGMEIDFDTEFCHYFEFNYSEEPYVEFKAPENYQKFPAYTSGDHA